MRQRALLNTGLPSLAPRAHPPIGAAVQHGAISATRATSLKKASGGVLPRKSCAPEEKHASNTDSGAQVTGGKSAVRSARLRDRRNDCVVAYGRRDALWLRDTYSRLLLGFRELPDLSGPKEHFRKASFELGHRNWSFDSAASIAVMAARSLSSGAKVTPSLIQTFGSTPMKLGVTQLRCRSRKSSKLPDDGRQTGAGKCLWPVSA